jgi:putative transposase
VNPKLVYRLLREDNLLCVRKRKFVVTTDSNHGRRVYPNLARNMILAATNQLWRADITQQSPPPLHQPCTSML